MVRVNWLETEKFMGGFMRKHELNFRLKEDHGNPRLGMALSIGKPTKKTEKF